jgi:hypothetical protein
MSTGVRRRMSIASSKANCDYVGACFRHSDRPGIAVGYLVRAAVVGTAMKHAQRKWIDAPASRKAEHNPDNRLFMLRFNQTSFEPGSNFAVKWAQYCIGEIEIEVAAQAPVAAPLATARKGTAELLERHQREIAAALGLAPEAVAIQITYR